MEDLIPIFGILFLFGAPVAAWVVSRVLAHQERMEMIRHGFTPPPDPRAYRGMWHGNVGTPPPPPRPGMPPPVPGYYDAYYAQHQLRKGITVTMVGFALLIGLSFIGMHGDGRMTYGPWLLGGLIPMFVGIAQVINAVLNGARFPGQGMPSSGSSNPSSFRPGPAPGPDVTPPPTPSGPYAWRPGSAPEIEKHD